jgi:hypothetical protein
MVRAISSGRTKHGVVSSKDESLREMEIPWMAIARSAS